MRRTIKIRVETSDYTTEKEFVQIQNAFRMALDSYNTMTANTVSVKSMWVARK